LRDEDKGDDVNTQLDDLKSALTSTKEVERTASSAKQKNNGASDSEEAALNEGMRDIKIASLNVDDIKELLELTKQAEKQTDANKRGKQEKPSAKDKASAAKSSATAKSWATAKSRHILQKPGVMSLIRALLPMHMTPKTFVKLREDKLERVHHEQSMKKMINSWDKRYNELFQPKHRPRPPPTNEELLQQVSGYKDYLQKVQEAELPETRRKAKTKERAKNHGSHGRFHPLPKFYG